MRLCVGGGCFLFDGSPPDQAVYYNKPAIFNFLNGCIHLYWWGELSFRYLVLTGCIVAVGSIDNQVDVL